VPRQKFPFRQVKQLANCNLAFEQAINTETQLRLPLNKLGCPKDAKIRIGEVWQKITSALFGEDGTLGLRDILSTKNGHEAFKPIAEEIAQRAIADFKKAEKKRLKQIKNDNIGKISFSSGTSQQKLSKFTSVIQGLDLPSPTYSRTTIWEKRNTKVFLLHP
jgi:hypothetical protein